MNCPKCGSSLKSQAKRCRGCGALIMPPNEKLTRKMTTEGRVAMVGGWIMLLTGAAILIYGSTLFGGLLLALGGAVALIGMKMG